ncbi:MAG: hypothetical protein WCJ59_02240, partial [bacterium]
MKNWKDTISTICGLVFALCTAIVTGVTGVTFPEWLITVVGIGLAVSGAIIGILQGKNPNLTTKTARQV